VYIRTSRPKTRVLYANDEAFPVGGSKTLRSSARDQATLVGAGVTLFEALAAHDTLAQEGVVVRVIDLYSVKPLDAATLIAAADATKLLVTVEDHSVCGGLGEAVAAAVAGRARVEILGIREVPRSGKPSELMHGHGIDAASIVAAVKRLLA
jgi:transketolase